MEEQFYTITKHASTFRIKSGIKGGRITARECEVWWNGGAFADIGPRVTQKSGFTAPGPYDIDNVAIDSYALYTNLPPAGALRGFGIPQLVWAYECHTDMIARALGIDPIEFRRKNILREGRPQATGTLMQDAAIEAVLDRLETRMNWTQAVRPRHRHDPARPRHRDRLQGLDLADHLDGHRQCRGRRQLPPSIRHRRHGPGLRHRDGADRRGSAQYSGRERQVVHPDTDVTPYDMATLGSRSMFHMRQRGEARRRGRARQAQGDGAPSVGLPTGSNIPLAELFREEIRHAGRQHHRHRQLHSRLHAARSPNGQSPERDAVLDGRRRRRRSRGRHRDRPRARDAG